ncbi:hypothetical protein DKX38_011389 [Salix brachista]|uniref:Transmembrane protein n=1 Tax=Salix brachista TaxID=2182728 RepID=A0A5N5M197_9ROSI|nr:hypothetical protein DKX38_011389 [Salix brachista]
MKGLLGFLNFHQSLKERISHFVRDFLKWEQINVVLVEDGVEYVIDGWGKQSSTVKGNLVVESDKLLKIWCGFAASGEAKCWVFYTRLCDGQCRVRKVELRLNCVGFGRRVSLVVAVLYAILGGTIKLLGIQCTLTMRLFAMKNAKTKSQMDLVEQSN